MIDNKGIIVKLTIEKYWPCVTKQVYGSGLSSFTTRLNQFQLERYITLYLKKPF